MLLRRDHQHVLALEVGKLRRDLFEPHQGVVRALLERPDYETIRRVDLLVAALGQLRFILGYARIGAVGRTADVSLFLQRIPVVVVHRAVASVDALETAELFKPSALARMMRARWTRA